MKILLAGNVNAPWSTNFFMKKSLEQLGHKVIPFNLRPGLKNNLYLPLTQKVWYRFRQEMEKGKIQRRLIGLVEKEKPDIFLLCKGKEIFPETLREIAKRIFTVYRYIDGPVLDYVINHTKESHCAFVTAGYLVPLLKEKTGQKYIYHLFEGCDPEIHRAVQPLSEMVCDLAIVGTGYKYRQDLAFECVKRGYNLKIWGYPNWSKRLPYQHRFAFNEDFAKVCASAKIMLGTNSHNNLPDYFSDRVFLTLACKGFFLVKYTPGLEHWFTNKEHLVWFHNFEEAFKLIDYYLTHPEQREEIACQGQKYVYKNFTWNRVMEQMLHIISSVQLKMS
ncbi:MAG: glycosyltransferase [Candidatus Edwardsbacteria bacterium]